MGGRTRNTRFGCARAMGAARFGHVILEFGRGLEVASVIFVSAIVVVVVAAAILVVLVVLVARVVLVVLVVLAVLVVLVGPCCHPVGEACRGLPCCS